MWLRLTLILAVPLSKPADYSRVHPPKAAEAIIHHHSFTHHSLLNQDHLSCIISLPFFWPVSQHSISAELSTQKKKEVIFNTAVIAKHLTSSNLCNFSSPPPLYQFSHCTQSQHCSFTTQVLAMAGPRLFNLLQLFWNHLPIVLYPVYIYNYCTDCKFISCTLFVVI